MRVVRTVFMGEPLAAAAAAVLDGGDADDAIWFKLLLEPREDRF